MEGFIDKIVKETLKTFPDSFLEKALYGNMTIDERIIKLQTIDDIINRAAGCRYRGLKRSCLRHLISDIIFSRLWTMCELHGSYNGAVDCVYENHSPNWRGIGWNPTKRVGRLVLAIPCGIYGA